jgi:hypothetical protein
MQLITGKTPSTIAESSLTTWAAGYDGLTLDLGAGDGAFIRHQATRQPNQAFIGIDTCGTNAREHSRRLAENARFVVADALAVPPELTELATMVTVNFPWGSLLNALLDGEPRLRALLLGGESIIRVNAGALTEQGYEFEAGIARIAGHLRPARPTLTRLDRQSLRQIPTTWSKRLAFGRDPRAVEFRIGRE